MELEHVRSLNGTPFWVCEHDGSLRNGMEFIHAEPVKGQGVIDSLAVLGEHLDRYDDSIVTSVRTSVHVHIDVRDLNEDERRAFLALCVVFEPLLYGLSGDKREGNPYCQTITGLRSHLRMALQGSMDFVDFSHIWEKYTSINLTRLHDLGTFEFRTLEGTTDMGRVLNFINVVTHIKELAVDYGDLAAVTDSFLPEASSILPAIIAQIPNEYLCNVSDTKDVSAGISNLRRVLGLTTPTVRGYEPTTSVKLKKELGEMPGIVEIPATMAKKLFGKNASKFVVKEDLEKI